MKRFRFRLEAVLHHRVVMEEQSMQAFAIVQHEMAACDERLSGLRSELARTVGQRPTSIDPAEIAVRERYIDSLNLRIEQEERVHEAIAIRLEEARAALVETRRAREAIERVRNNDYAEYQRAVLKAEQDALDETGTQRHIRRMAS